MSKEEYLQAICIKCDIEVHNLDPCSKEILRKIEILIS